MIEYVLGFLFDTKGERVALIKKTKPNWQAGCLNGIGGKVEENESVHEAMVREFEEEAGVHIPKWEYICMMSGEGWMVRVFRAFSDEIDKVETKTEEVVGIYPVDSYTIYKRVSNLDWLIPFVLVKDCRIGTIFMY